MKIFDEHRHYSYADPIPMILLLYYIYKNI